MAKAQKAPFRNIEQPWVNVYLGKTDDAEVDAFIASLSDGPELAAELEKLTSDGISFGLQYRDQEDAFCCTLRDPARQEQLRPYLLSGWDSTAIGAIGVALYKHRIRLQEDWDNGNASETKSTRR